MYTTKTLSQCKTVLSYLSQQPEGPNSGYLVIDDEETDPITSTYYKSSRNPAIRGLPFPQNKLLTIDAHDHDFSYRSMIYLIPVINQPLSSNLYYIIKADANDEGAAYTSSSEDDMTTCCFCTCINDVKPQTLDPNNIYQQFEISITKTRFVSNHFSAKSAASNGHTPIFLRRFVKSIKGTTPPNLILKQVSGLNPSLRARLPDFNTFTTSQQCSNPIVVGTWYCPFMFIYEGSKKDRVTNSVFYEMSLEQRWERVFHLDNNNEGYDGEKTGVVRVDVVVESEVVRIRGELGVRAYGDGSKGKKVVWFKGRDGEVGLSKVVMERIMWEEERVGWVRGNEENQVKVVKEEVYVGMNNGNGNNWRSFGCYVLVERFVLKRNDGSVVMTYDFMHAHQVRTKWE